MDYERQHWLNTLFEKDSRLYCNFRYSDKKLCKQEWNHSESFNLQQNRTKSIIVSNRFPSSSRRQISLKGIKRHISPKLTMAQLKNRIKYGQNKEQVIPTRDQNPNQWIVTQRCVTEQQESDFSQKFYWKSIPEKLQVRHRVVLDNFKKQPVTNNNFLQRPPEKNYLSETKVSTNGYQSIQISKEMPKQCQNSMRLQNEVIQRSNFSKLIHEKMALDNESVFQSEMTKRSKKMRGHDIEEVESISRSRLTELSQDNSKRDYALEQSFVEWTYQTGFKSNPLGFQQMR